MVSRNKKSKAWLLGVALLLAPACAWAQGMFNGANFQRVPALPAAVQDIGIDQKLNQQVPLQLTFRDETGKQVKLGDYFDPGGHKPVMLMLVYYTCPMLCNEVLQGVSGGMKTLKFTAGDDFNVVTVSIDPNDGPTQAATKRAQYLSRYGRPQGQQGWHFLTGDQANIDALAKAVGFRYRWDTERKQFIHAAGIMLTTPDGRLSRYLYGVEFAPRDLELGLVEASQNRIGNVVDQVLLLCYHYDPTVGKYTPVVLGAVRIGGVLTMLGLGGFIGLMLRRERANARGKAA